MAPQKPFDPTSFMLSSMEDVLDGIVDSFIGSKKESGSSRSSSYRDSTDRRQPSEFDAFDDYDDDDDQSYHSHFSYTSSAASDTSSTATEIPSDIRAALEQLTAALSSIPDVSTEKILNFCKDKRNWPVLRWLLAVGIAVVGLAVLVALVNAVPPSQQNKP